MEKNWNVHEALKTKAVKELAKEMFDYYKNDSEELFKFLRATASERNMWEKAYRGNVIIWNANRGILQTNSDRCARNFAIYKELYNELYILIHQSL